MSSNRRATGWTFDRVVREVKEHLAEYGHIEQQAAFWRESLIDQLPHVQAGQFRHSLDTLRWAEALYLFSKGHSSDAWRRVHLVWRYDAFSAFVYISQLERLYFGLETKPSRRIPIGDIDDDFLTEFLLTCAFSVTLGEDHFASWLGGKCLAYLQGTLPYVREDAFRFGPVAPFLMKLFTLWKNIPIDLMQYGVDLDEPFRSICLDWESPQNVEDATLELCKLHARRALRYQTEDSNVLGIHVSHHNEFPTEITFLQRVRKDLGLSIPNPEHPILRTPLFPVPFPSIKSGYDPFLAEVYDLCRQQVPGLQVPWEDEYQKYGMGDPNMLPMTDLVLD